VALTFSKNSRRICFYENGQLESANIEGIAIVNGIKFKKSIQFHENGQIRWTYPTEDTIFQNFPCKAGEAISFYENGNLRRADLAVEFTYNGIKYQEDEIGFYEAGQFESGKLAQNTLINKMLFQFGTKVTFYKNGNLKYGAPAKDTVIDEVLYEAGKYLNFSETGEIIN